MQTRTMGGVTVFGQAVKRARTARGWSQEVLGGRVGTDQTTISQIERGIFRPKYDTVLRLADAFGVQPEPWVEMAGYRVTGEDRAANGAGQESAPLPPVILAAWRELERKHPELIPQLADRQGDPDFAGQIVDLSTALGYVIRGFLGTEIDKPGEG